MSANGKLKVIKQSGFALFLVLGAIQSSFAGELPIPLEDRGVLNGDGKFEYFLTMQEGTVGCPGTRTFPR